MKIVLFLGYFGILASARHVKGASNTTRKRASEDYYQISYDYEIPNNNSLDVQFSSDSLILPIPDDSPVGDSDNSDNAEENINADLKDHDLIDNLKYIYYGPSLHHNTTIKKNDGAKAIVVFCAMGTFFKILTMVVLLTKRVVRHIPHKKDVKELFMNVVFSLCIADVAFLLGIFRTKNFFECLMVGLALSYFRLMSSVWIFLYTYHIFKLFCKEERIKREYFYICGYGLPLLYSLGAFLLAPETYETEKFCFMSVQKGMILNYMVPISFLLILTAVYCIRGIRIFNMELQAVKAKSNLDTQSLYDPEIAASVGKESFSVEAVNLRNSKSCLTKLCILQTLHDVEWFILVLAMENSGSDCMMPVYILPNNLVNCLLLSYVIKLAFFPRSNKFKDMDEDTTKSCNGIEMTDLSHEKSEGKQGSSDSIPLLIDSPDLITSHQTENISTISS